MAKIVIAGAGLTGLSAAYHCEKQGHELFIAEKGALPGGLLRSEQENGFTFDYTGHYLHISDEYFRYFLEMIFGFSSMEVIQRRASIFTHERTLSYPFQMNLYGLPSEVIIECIDGFVNRATRYKQPTTFYQWVLKHFGAGIGNHFFFPFNGKLLSYDVRKIHPSWTGRFVPKVTLDEVLRGSLMPQESRGVGYNSSFYYPKKGGIYSLIAALTEKIKTKAHLMHEVVEINVAAKKVLFSNGTTESYDYLVSTMPLKSLLQRLKGSGVDRLVAASNKLWCNSVINFNLGFNRVVKQKDHWVYFPEKKYQFYRVGFWHNVSSSLVPEGCSSLYGETSFMPHQITREEQEKVVDQAIAQTMSVFGIADQDVIARKNLFLEHAYVIYDAWREKNLAALLSQLQGFGIHSVGRFGEWKYSSMQEAVLDGRAVAEAIDISLSQHANRYQEALAFVPSKEIKKGVVER